MRAVFADTSFFLASLNPDDELHDIAIRVSREVKASRVTTGFVLLELANAMSGAGQRAQFVEFYVRLSQHDGVRIVPVSEELFRKGYETYAARKDKNWSLTHCISFVVMAEEGVSEALTHDHHFEQAGYTRLLRKQV